MTWYEEFDISLYVFLLFGVLVSSISQVLLKKAAMMPHDSLIKEYINVKVIVANIMFFASTFFSIIAYKGIPLSLEPVLEATSYIYVTIFGITIFKEKIGSRKILPLGLIIIGIFIYSMWG